LIDLEQNVITRVLSISALIFLPPTIISSAYGMNFDTMPIIHFEYGFELALLLIFISAVLPYFYCKKKGIL
jgi:magnesium transporter